MVKYAEILASNKSFFASPSAPNAPTAVFIGATNGIGLGTLRAFAKYTTDKSPTLYVVGRTKEKLDSLQSSIAAINSSATFIPIVAGDLTQLQDAKAAADHIAKEVGERGKVDYLFMTPGYISAHRDPNPSGLDRVQTIRVYTRMLFLRTLAPYLRRSPHPKVVSVLMAGLEGNLWADDLALEHHYGLMNATGAAASMTSLFLEEFVKQPGNENIVAIHIHPGMVGGTGIKVDGLGKIGAAIASGIFKPFMGAFGHNIEESGERVVFAATNERFVSKDSANKDQAELGSDGVRGSGLYMLKGDSSPIPGNKTLTKLRGEGFREKVWTHVIEKLEESAEAK